MKEDEVQDEFAGGADEELTPDWEGAAEPLPDDWPAEAEGSLESPGGEA